MSSVLCNDCACENVACGRCICLHSRSIAKEFKFPASEKISEQKETTFQSRLKIAKNSNFCSTSDRRAVSFVLMKMLDAAGFPVTSKDKTSILFNDRLYNYILQVLRIVGFFLVLSAEKDESVYFFLKSLSHVHHAVFLILVLLQRNQDVDSVVLEHLRYSTIFSRFEFFPLLLQCRSDLPMQVRHTEQSACNLVFVIFRWRRSHSLPCGFV